MKKKWKEIRSRIEYVLLRLAIMVARIVPAVVLRKGAQVLFEVVQFRKKLAESNLQHVLGDVAEQEHKRILNEMYGNLALTAVESYLENKKRVFEKIKIEGWEEVEKVRAAGRGVIIASGHLGNFEMAGRCIGQRARVLVVVKRQHNPYFDKYANAQRLADNCLPVAAGETLKPILKTLRGNGVVVIMTDQNGRSQGYQLDFMGKAASTHISAAKIAIRTGTPMIIAGVSRQSNGYPVMHFGKAIDVSQYENNLRGHIALMQRVNDEFGALVKQYPSHWFWVHRRWRRPEIAHPLPEEAALSGESRVKT